MPQAGMQTSLADPGSDGPDGRKIGRADLEIVQNKPEFRLQLDSLQGLTSDGFVSPPAIEPNHDMGHTDESVELVSSPIENETALVDAPLAEVVGCTFSIANTRETKARKRNYPDVPIDHSWRSLGTRCRCIDRRRMRSRSACRRPATSDRGRLRLATRPASTDRAVSKPSSDGRDPDPDT